MKNLKKLKPTTPSRRQQIRINKKHLLKKPFIKLKTVGLKNPSGRNHSGKITVRHIGGGCKKNYRIIDFNRSYDSTAVVCSIEYDPNRNAFIASALDLLNHNFYYILAPKNLNVGDIVKSGNKAIPALGNSLPISKIPVGSFIHNISLKPEKGGQLVRSAGVKAKLIEKYSTNAKIELSSGIQKLIPVNCFASFGIVSNEMILYSKLGKAGQSRWANKRPTVRGVAMNPVDHPNGGGEGKKSGKSLSPWGKPVKFK